MGLILNHKEKFAFIHIPKTGGTSLSNILLKVHGSEHITNHNSIRLLNDVDNYFIFTIVRNPFTRLTSAYLQRQREGNPNSFDKFIKKIDYKDLWYFPQSYFINSGKTKNRKVSFIARYENYNNDIKFILNKIGVEDSIPHLNRNPIYDKHPNLQQKKYYNFFYTEEWMKDWVRERYTDDFKQFNYELEI